MLDNTLELQGFATSAIVMPQEAICKRNDLAFPMRLEVVNFDVQSPISQDPTKIGSVDPISFFQLPVECSKRPFFC
jgi:hypothetical protein